jgi:hypothetical protein
MSLVADGVFRTSLQIIMRVAGLSVERGRKVKTFRTVWNGVFFRLDYTWTTLHTSRRFEKNVKHRTPVRSVDGGEELRPSCWPKGYVLKNEIVEWRERLPFQDVALLLRGEPTHNIDLTVI